MVATETLVSRQRGGGPMSRQRYYVTTRLDARQVQSCVATVGIQCSTEVCRERGGSLGVATLMTLKEACVVPFMGTRKLHF